MKVKKLMTRQVVTASPQMSLKEATRIMLNHKISGLPVVDGSGVVVGMVTEGDIAHLESIRRPGTSFMSVLKSSGKPAVTVGEVMTKKVVTVDADVDHSEAARLMESARAKRLPVVGKDKALVGLISRSDLLRAFGRGDDDIADEIDVDVVKRILWLDSESVEVGVQEGQVTLAGRVPTRSDARILEEMTRRIDGVVNVDASGLAYEIDDSRRADSPMSGGLRTPNW